jgi:hypothetical protein
MSYMKHRLDERKSRGGAREGAGRKAGGRNKTTLMAMQFREQILESSYSPLVVMQKNVEWTQGEAEKLDAALADLDLARMPAEKIEALNETRRQAIALRSKANDFAAQAAPYVQPKPVPIDDPVTLDLSNVATAEAVMEAQNKVLMAIADGDISPEQGAKITAIVENRRKAIETVEFERRIAAMESKNR